MSEAEFNDYTETGDSADVVYNCDEAQDTYLVEDDTNYANEYEQQPEQHGDDNGAEAENTEELVPEADADADAEPAEQSHTTSEYIVNLHGLPYNSNYDEISGFLDGCTIAGGAAGVHFCYGDDGRANGDAFVELSSADDLKQALTKHRKHIGRRYIEVYKVDQKEMEFVLKRSSKEAVEARINKGETDSVVRLRGLPFGCTKEEIANFFLGLAIAPGGILIVTDEMGRAAGDGFVQFTSPELVEKALEKNKEKIGHRYIEVFRSTSQEMHKRSRPPPLMSQRPGPYDRPDFGGGRYGGKYGNRMSGNVKGYDGGRVGGGYGGGGGGGGMYGGGRSGMGDYGRNYGGSGSRYGGGGRDMYDSGRSRFGGGGGGGGGGGMGGRGDQRGGRGVREFHSTTGHYVYMRGLPYSSSEKDIFKFFSPIDPVRVCFEYGSDGRPTGNANVDFDCEASAREAMRKHKNLIEHRYIELFLNGVGASR